MSFWKRRTAHIALTGDISPGFVSELRVVAAQMQVEQRTARSGHALTLIVDSKGGYSEHRIRIVDTLRWHFPELRFNALVTGFCQSGAVPICAAGFKGGRVALRGTSFMTHISHTSYEARRLPFDEFERQAQKELESHVQQREHYLTTMVECTFMDRGFWAGKLTAQSHYFGVEEALEYGLIDYVADTMADAVDFLQM